MTEYHLNGETFRSYRYSWGAIHRAVTMREAGEAHADIVAASGLTKSTLIRLLKVLGLKDPQHIAAQKGCARRFGKDYRALEAEAVRLHDQGVSQREIMDVLGVSASHVNGALRRKGRRARTKSQALRMVWADRRRREVEDRPEVATP